MSDALCIVAGLAIAVGGGLTTRIDHYIIAAAVAIIVYGLAAETGDMYRSWRGVSVHREAIGTLLIWGFTCAILLALGFATKHTHEFSRISTCVWFAVTPALIVASRLATRWIQRILLSLGYHTRKFAIVGVNELGFQLARNIEASPEMGLRLAGFFDDRPEERSPDIPAELGHRLGTIQDLVDQARAGSIDRIYITFPMRAEDRIRGVLDKLGDTTASVYVVPDFFVFQLLHSRWTDILGLPVVSVFENPFYGIDGLAKRLSDLFLGGLALLLAAAPMAVIAVLIKLTSPGPVFFRQRRYGLDGQEIRVWKFRTMTVCEDGPQAVQASAQRSPRHLARRHSAPDVVGRVAAVVQRAGGEHVAGGSAAAPPRPERGVPHADWRLHAASQGEARHHRPGPGQRLARRDRLAGEDAETNRVRPPLHPRVVAVAGSDDPGKDRVGGGVEKECVLERGIRD